MVSKSKKRLILSLIIATALLLSSCNITDIIGGIAGSDGNDSSTLNPGTGVTTAKPNGDGTIPEADGCEDLEFTLNADRESYTVTGIGACVDSNLVIPSRYNGKQVTAISEDAFHNCYFLCNVTVPDSVTSIGLDPFLSCHNLRYNEYDNAYYLGNEDNPYAFLIKVKNEEIEECNIHPDTKVIAGGVFHRCNLLTGITIPAAVTNIGDNAFGTCCSLTNISVDENNKYYKSIDGVLYSKDGKTLVYYPEAKEDTSFVIPDSVTYIENQAFLIGDSIGYSPIFNEYDNAYYIGKADNPYFALIRTKNSNTLNCIIHPETKIICSEAFYCRPITSITIPEGVTSIGCSAFDDCWCLTSVIISDSVKNIDQSAFARCTSLTSITIGKGVTNIGSRAFSGCTLLTSVTIPDSVTSIGSSAFSYCTSLTNIDVDENNEYYKSVDGNLYTKDGKMLVQYAVGKQDGSFTVPDGVTSIAWNAFRGCTSLTGVTMPDSITIIYRYAFSGCPLQSLIIGNGVKTICESAFAYCEALTNVTIPDNVTSIGYDAFYCCTSLTGVSIGNGVKKIGDGAFFVCTSLSEIHYNGTKEQWNSLNKKNNFTSNSYTVYCADGNALE